ncbi:hypothetical protein LOZ53_004400 [Ophidiomyces ophidiicola]|nr:hypothetical protein LOZ55_004648 [Ophidiomyces ophidiicola]KAI1984693.1 hypothetical protein LOZ51_006590 [Ophidiomyces ophidiicola]KAI1987344.1 hypothetical protein LOZ53_004400 [Ophidiomyces ophidiicola]KAI1993151.1 hypothetical protein LOZ54_001500 [Ophidiomyces ophidiicola]
MSEPESRDENQDSTLNGHESISGLASEFSSEAARLAAEIEDLFGARARITYGGNTHAARRIVHPPYQPLSSNAALDEPGTTHSSPQNIVFELPVRQHVDQSASDFLFNINPVGPATYPRLLSPPNVPVHPNFAARQVSFRGPTVRVSILGSNLVATNERNGNRAQEGMQIDGSTRVPLTPQAILNMMDTRQYPEVPQGRFAEYIHRTTWAQIGIPPSGWPLPLFANSRSDRPTRVPNQATFTNPTISDAHQARSMAMVQVEENEPDENDIPPEPIDKSELLVNFQCKVCLSQRIDTVLIPCGHVALCRWCSKRWIPRNTLQSSANCPICAKTVHSKYRIYVP